MAGALFNRYKWRMFRKRFIDLGLKPMLDYRKYRHIEMEKEGGVFRFAGGIESITGGSILWVRGEDLTIPVSLEKTKCFLLPKHEGNGMPEAPEQIRWNRVSTLTEGVKVFIGGQVITQDNRLNFVSTKENPLIVIFYNCADNELTTQIIRAARNYNEYWNTLTPASLCIGAATLVFIAASLLNRPAFRLNVISAMVALFTPLFPIIPPGLLLTALFRRITLYTNKLRTQRDLMRTPYGYLKPDIARHATKAYFLEVLAWLILALGVFINLIFILFILSMLEAF